MKNLLFDRCSNLLSALKRLPIARVAIVLAASFMMLVSTACSNATPPVSSNPSNPAASKLPTPVSSGEGSYHSKSNANQPTELYDPIQKREGGMNMYSDTDPRYQRDKLGNQIERRVDKAEQNLERSIDDVEDYADNYTSGAPLGKRIRNITDSVGESAEDLTEQVKEGTERGVQNLKVTTSRAERNASQAVKGVAEDAKDNARELNRKAARALD